MKERDWPLVAARAFDEALFAIIGISAALFGDVLGVGRTGCLTILLLAFAADFIAMLVKE